MLSKRIVIACLSASLALTGATRAAADAGDAIAGAIVGGILGHAIAKDQQRKRVVVRRAPRSSGISAAQRQANRDMQTALNYFGFNAGSVDGAVGPGTRGAVSRYQAQMGYPASGHIQAYERDFLMSAYSWATSGGAATAGATTPQNLLISYRRAMSGVPATPAAPQVVTPPATTVVVAPQPAAPAMPQSTTTTMTTTVTASAPEESPEIPGLALPNFMGENAETSLASHCNKVSLLTNTNGGFVTEAELTDAAFALDEQFCLARTYAIAAGEELTEQVEGFSPQQIAAQCDAFGPAMRDHVAALSLKPEAEVQKDVAGFVLESGMSPAQLSGTAKICLSVGYRTDDMDVAVGSALLLVALGERVYGELLGHHLARGFGASQRPDLALAWYEMGLDAVDNGGRAVFAPGQPERQDLIRKAAMQVNGIAPSDDSATAAPVPAAATLPTFAIQQ